MYGVDAQDLHGGEVVNILRFRLSWMVERRKYAC